MIINSKILIFLLFLVLVTPSVSFALETQEDEISMTEDLTGKEAKAERKKEKEKDIVNITPRFFITLAIDVTMVLLIIFLIYYPNYRKMDTIFTFIVFNIMIFLLTFVLNKVKISMGAAFGLFAVFSMLRYRTEGIGMKDMTYLFIFIAIGLISGIQPEYTVLGIICAIVFVVTLVLDTKIFLKRELTQSIEFEKIELIRPELNDDLIAELKNRTGLKIHRITIKKLDYLRDTASIRIYYYE